MKQRVGIYENQILKLCLDKFVYKYLSRYETIKNKLNFSYKLKLTYTF